MKKTGVINKDISEVIAGMGHLDMLVVADAGLPIPAQVRRIDLAFKPGSPAFVDVVQTIAEELQVQSLILAEETGRVSPHIEEAVFNIFNQADIEKIPHEEFKKLTNQAVAVIRTGEFTPYANVILVSGVVF